MPDSLRIQRLAKRYAQRFKPRIRALDQLLEALQTLSLVTTREDPLFLAHGLDLLIEHLKADCAYMVNIEQGLLDTQWWAPERPSEPPPMAVPSFSRWLLDNPFRTLVLRNIPEDERVKDDPDLVGRTLQACAGTVLWGEGRIKGLLFVEWGQPQELDRADLALFNAVASFLARVLEVEVLKFSLLRLENALAITKAVVEDSSICDPLTDLPNLRYLDIWLQANLSVASTQPEHMTVAEFLLPVESREDQRRIKEAGERVRGGDLLVAVGPGRFMLILQRTAKGLGHIFLLRLRQKLGERPMGATVWIPGQDDNRLESVRRRIDVALEQSKGMERPALVWKLLEMPETE